VQREFKFVASKKRKYEEISKEEPEIKLTQKIPTKTKTHIEIMPNEQNFYSSHSFRLRAEYLKQFKLASLMPS